ncbi:MAG: hypothetical protein JNM26_02045 [Ideonella sp.]|nr:hypothetical protein [Ideonella sp.]
MAGRPTDYSEEVAERICLELMNGRALCEITQADDMPAQSTVYKWLLRYPEFVEMYNAGRKFQAETMADRATLMALKGSSVIVDPQAAAVQLNAIKWAAGRLDPRKYGDKQDINIGGQENGAPVKVETVYRWAE